MDNDAVHINWLQVQLIKREDELTAAENTVARLRPLVANLRGTIEALQAETKDSRTEPLFPVNPQAPPVNETSVSEEGSRRAERKPAFLNMSHRDAIKKVLSANPSGLHAKLLTKAVFDCKTEEQFRYALHATGSELYRGHKAGIFEKLGGNRYALKPIPQNQNRRVLLKEQPM